MVVHAMHDLLWQYQFRFLATVCLSLFPSKQCIIKQLLDLVLVISWIIKVLVSIIILGLLPRPWLFQISQKHHPIIMFIIMSIILILVVIVSCNFQIICNVILIFYFCTFSGNLWIFGILPALHKGDFVKKSKESSLKWSSELKSWNYCTPFSDQLL